MTLPPRDSLFAWPGLAHLWRALILSLAVSAWFAFIYVGADWITHQRADLVRVDMAFERQIPFVPAASLVYLSVNLPSLMAPFVLRQRRELNAMAITMAVAIGVAGICFLLFPADLRYDPGPDPGMWRPFVALADRLNLRYNLFPSLHVALALIAIAPQARHGGKLFALVMWLWVLAISVSTLLVHQHHIIDVIGGLALALACDRLIYARLTRRPSSQPVLPSVDRSDSTNHS